MKHELGRCIYYESLLIKAAYLELSKIGGSGYYNLSGIKMRTLCSNDGNKKVKQQKRSNYG